MRPPHLRRPPRASAAAPRPASSSSSSGRRPSGAAPAVPRPHRAAPAAPPARGGAPVAPAPAPVGDHVLTVAVDVDEVLGRFLHSLNAYVRDAHGLHVAEADYHVYEFAKVWNVSPDSANEIVHAFFASPHFADGVPPIPGAAPALARMGRYAKLAVVTSRQHVIRDATLDWLDAHFPNVFAAGGVHFGNHWALSGTSRTKAEMCAELGASILIDDNPRYAVECAAAGVDVLLYDWEGGYPWAKLGEGEGGDRITVVRDWREVEAAVAAVAAARR